MAEATPPPSMQVRREMTSDRIGWVQRIGWASGDIGINFYWRMIGGFLYFFYTDLLGLSPVWAGIAFGIGSFWDGLCDPIVGAIADRTRSRYGRFRPYLLYLSLPCAISFILAFYKPPIAGDWLIVYAIVTHIIFRTLITTISVTYGALSARMSVDSNERGTLAALRMVAAGLGSFAVGVMLPKLLASHSNPQTAYLIATSLLGAGATIILLITFLTTREAIEPALDGHAPMGRSPSSAFRQLGRDILNFWQVLRYNLPLRLLFIALIVSSIAGSMFDKLAIYWYKYDFKDISVMALTAPFALVVFLVSIPIWTLVSRITSKRTVWLMGALIGMSFYTTFYLLNPRDVNVIIALSMLGAAGGAAGYVMFWAMLPDTVEYNEWKLGDRAEARIFGFAGMAQKSALAVNAIIVGLAFELIGFVPGREQTPTTLHAMLAVMCLVPVAGTIVTVLTMWRYPLNARFHREIVEDIRARAGSAPKPDDHYFKP